MNPARNPANTMAFGTGKNGVEVQSSNSLDDRPLDRYVINRTERKRRKDRCRMIATYDSKALLEWLPTTVALTGRPHCEYLDCIVPSPEGWSRSPVNYRVNVNRLRSAGSSRYILTTPISPVYTFPLCIHNSLSLTAATSVPHHV
eukprot:scaffold5681_cov196-Alexandrium_tamarense.AAC.1